jgi:hypothetical protein
MLVRTASYSKTPVFFEGQPPLVAAGLDTAGRRGGRLGGGCINN